MNLSLLPENLVNKIFYFIGNKHNITSIDLLWEKDIIMDFRYQHCINCGEFVHLNRLEYLIKNIYYKDKLCFKCYFYNCDKYKQLFIISNIKHDFRLLLRN